VWMDGNTIADGRVGLAAVGPNTITIDAARDALTGATPSEELYAQVGAICAANCEPDTDMRGSAEYKKHLANELTQRSLRTAVARATGQEA
jgi:carbon-monoxide dehydrogenase medium subunit